MTCTGRNEPIAKEPTAGSRRPPLRAVAVTVPAHDEQEMLGACLDHLAGAVWRARAAGLSVVVTVVADACTDATRATARARGVHCLTINGRNVGAARAAGVVHGLSLLADESFHPSQIYLLNTDADTLVPPEWIERHVRLAADCDAVLGDIKVRDWSTRRPGTASFYACARRRDSRLRVYGANLGLRAEAYLRAGGFTAAPVAEDRMLIEALRATGGHIVFPGDLTVSTSARKSRRLSGGFSDYLSRLESSVPVGAAVPHTAAPHTAAPRTTAPPTPDLVA